MNKDDIVEQVTSELLEEIKNSNKSFSNEEVKEKINKRLDTFFNEKKEEENLLKANLDEEDKILNDEFTKIDGDDDLLSLNSNTTESFNENNVDEKGDEKIVKKKFFQEIKDVYKDEFNNSINCFKNAFDALKFTKKTSLFETILIFIFLIIPAIFAGSIAIIVVLVLLLLWQLYLITKSILELLKKAEISITSLNEKIKRKIKDFKNSGGFLNKLIFSNALYSLVMFNGMMYMLIKGLILPLKSITSIEKVLANVLAKLEKDVTTVLKAPSELALANTKTQAFKEQSQSKEKQKDSLLKVKKEKKKEKKQVIEKEKVVERQKPLEKEKSQVKSQQNMVNDISIPLHQNKLEFANTIVNNLQTEVPQQKVQDFNDKVFNLAERPDKQQAPASSMLSFPPIEFERVDILGLILNNIANAMGKSLENAVEKTNELANNFIDKTNPDKNIETLNALDEAKQGLQQELNRKEQELSKAIENGDANLIEKAQFARDTSEHNIEQFEEGKQNVETPEQAQQLAQLVQKDDPSEYANKIDSITFNEDGSRVLPEGFSMRETVDNINQNLSNEDMKMEIFTQLNDKMSELGYEDSQKEIVIATVIPYVDGLTKEIDEAKGVNTNERGDLSSNRGKSFSERVLDEKNNENENTLNM